MSYYDVHKKNIRIDEHLLLCSFCGEDCEVLVLFSINYHLLCKFQILTKRFVLMLSILNESMEEDNFHP